MGVAFYFLILAILTITKIVTFNAVSRVGTPVQDDYYCIHLFPE